MDLAGGQAPGEEAGEHPLLGWAEAVNHDGCRIPSHYLGVLFPAQCSCKTEARL